MKYAHIISMFLLLVVISGCVEEGPEEGWMSTKELSDRWYGLGWQSIGIIAIMICLIFNAIIYMIGHGFQLEGVKRWATGELLNAVASAIMILLLISLVDGALTFAMKSVMVEESTIVCAGRMYKVGEINPIEFIKDCRIAERITKLDDLYKSIFRKNLGTERSMSITLYILGFPFFYGWMIPEWYSDVQKAHFLGQQIVPLLISLHGQYVLMKYIAGNMLTFFLPIGIVLRTFPPTRGIGGLFIATAIGFYIIFPTLFIINDPTFVPAPPSPEIPLNLEEQCYTGFKGSATLISSFEQQEAEEIMLDYESAGAEIAGITIDIMFFPFIALAGTLIFIRATSVILGGDMGEMMRMVAKVT